MSMAVARSWPSINLALGGEGPRRTEGERGTERHRESSLPRAGKMESLGISGGGLRIGLDSVSMADEGVARQEKRIWPGVLR